MSDSEEAATSSEESSENGTRLRTLNRSLSSSPEKKSSVKPKLFLAGSILASLVMMTLVGISSWQLHYFEHQRFISTQAKITNHGKLIKEICALNKQSVEICYHVNYQFQYQVDQVTFSGSGQADYYDLSQAQEFLEILKSNQTIPIRYDTEDHQKYFLSSPYGGPDGLWVLGIIFGCIGSALLLSVIVVQISIIREKK